MGVRAGARRAHDQLFFRLTNIVEIFVGQIRPDGKRDAVGAGRSEPLEFPHVEADLLDLGELGDGDVRVGGENREPVRFRHIENLIGREHMRRARHLLNDHDGISRDVLPEMVADDLGRRDQAAGALGADDERDRLSRLEIRLCARRRNDDDRQQKDQHRSRHS